ncbi:hypothetical protein HYT17_00880 [Candidatus Microgenomates bacterium]|nr:hypothetical protein [Candidatus Microgenomates bacterium]
MQASDPAIFYLGLILPGLFALILIAEGAHKLTRYEPGWVNIILGSAFLLIIVIAYIFFLR